MKLAPLWQLRLDLIWVLLLLRIFTAGRRGEPKPEVHYFLGDRYWRLAGHYGEKGAKRKAAELRAKANYHLRLGGRGPSLPPAAAMAMPVPQRPTLAAIGWWVREEPPDDAA